MHSECGMNEKRKKRKKKTVTHNEFDDIENTKRNETKRNLFY